VLTFLVSAHPRKGVESTSKVEDLTEQIRFCYPQW
jgi:hypothetical protein